MTLLIGWVVAVLDVAQFLPQARRAAGRRHDRAAIRGLSPWTWSIATVQGTAWIVYGLAEHLLPIAIPNLVITPICATILSLRLVYGSSTHG